MRRLWKTFWRLFLRALMWTYRDGCLGIAKAAAYSALLSFFPLLTTIATLLLQARAEFLSDMMQDFLAQILPPGTEELVFQYFVTKGNHPVLLPVTGMLISVWAASGVMASLMEGFRKAYGIPSGRSFVHDRVVAILLVFSAAIPALISSALILFGRSAEHWIGRMLGFVPAGQELRGGLLVASAAIRYLVSLASIILGTAILYYFGPNRKQSWRGVFPGAIIATLLWYATTGTFAWYARNIANYNVLYGSIAAVIALLIWMYLLAIIAFIGCEFNAHIDGRPRKP